MQRESHGPVFEGESKKYLRNESTYSMGEFLVEGAITYSYRREDQTIENIFNS